MSLSLNGQKIRKPYEEFEGRVADTMPFLLADSREVLSTAELMERRLNSNEDDWRNAYFFVGDAVAYNDGKVKIALDAPILRGLNVKSNLRNGALVVDKKTYDGIQGTEFSKSEIAKMLTDRDLTPEEAIQHPVWQALARDPALLKEYVGKMFEKMKDKFDYDTGMGFYPYTDGKGPNVRALVVGRLEDGSQLGGCNVGGRNGRLVGVARDALSAPGRQVVVPTLEQALAVVNRSIEGLQLRTKQ